MSDITKKYTPVTIRRVLKNDLQVLAGRVAAKEGLSKLSIGDLIEKMKKVYEDHVDLD